MEGKEYPTRSKSGVRKIRTPWDNSSSLLFDELVAQKKSPKVSPAPRKGKESPKTGRKSASKSPAATPAHAAFPRSTNRKVEGKGRKSSTVSPNKLKPQESGKKAAKISPKVAGMRFETSPLTKILYDYSHSPTAQIAAVTVSASKGVGEGGGGGRKYGGLYKVQGTKTSKSEQRKLVKSLKIFDFSSDSESEKEEEEVPVRKAGKPKAATRANEGAKEKTEPPKKKQTANYRYCSIIGTFQ